jgi:phage RecT family recombinase
MSSAIQKKPIDVWKDNLSIIRVQIENVLPKDIRHLSVERFVQQVLVAMSKNPSLMDCDKNSVFQSVIAMAELGLDPSGALGSGYLVPFKGVCTPVPGYRGLIDLAVRSGDVKAIKAEVVFWGDEFALEEGDKPRLWHKPMIPQSKDDEKKMEDHRSSDNVRGAYSVATLAGGVKQFCFMTFKELETVRLRAPGGKSERTPWFTDRVEMYKKSPIRRIVKQLPLSPIKASALIRAEQIEEDNERVVEKMGSDEDVAVKPKTVADGLKAALRKDKSPPPEDAQFVSTDEYKSEEPPTDVILPK